MCPETHMPCCVIFLIRTLPFWWPNPHNLNPGPWIPNYASRNPQLLHHSFMRGPDTKTPEVRGFEFKIPRVWEWNYTIPSHVSKFLEQPKKDTALILRMKMHDSWSSRDQWEKNSLSSWIYFTQRTCNIQKTPYLLCAWKCKISWVREWRIQSADV